MSDCNGHIQGEPGHEEIFFCPDCTFTKTRTKLAEVKKELNNWRESLSVFNHLRLLYKNTANMQIEPVKSATQLLMKQCEDGIRASLERQQKEYIVELQADLTAKRKEAAYEKQKVFNLNTHLAAGKEQYKELKDTVQISCNPPDDCNDPKVLKTYMKACFEQSQKGD